MKKRPILTVAALALLVLFALAACRGGAGEQQGGYRLYFPVTRDTSYGAALDTQPWEGEGTPTPEQLVQGLLAGPTREGLRAPFPGAVSVLSLEVEAGTARLSLSEQYGGLTDMGKTLADACIVLTLCQLEGVEQVEISAEGFWTDTPVRRTLSPAQLELEALLP